MKKICILWMTLLLISPIHVFASDLPIPTPTEDANIETRSIEGEEMEGKDEPEEKDMMEEKDMIEGKDEAVTTAAEDLIQNAKAGILIDAVTGEIMFEKNSHERMAVASLTKMVAQILILEAVEKGVTTWDEKVTVSANASGMGGSQIWLETGEVMSVQDLMKGISMGSANDATVALAEKIGGTEANFVQMMNDKVKSLGLSDTNFVNPTGLDEENHYSSAYDLAMIAKELLTHEKILEFSSPYEDYLRQDTETPYWLVNTNKLVRFYDGADGLKTGHTDNAGYCLAGTAKKDNMRLIAIVLGEPSASIRNTETMALLDYGFNLYQMNLIKSKNESLGSIDIEKGSISKAEIITGSDIGVVEKKGTDSSQYTQEIKLDEITLPIKKGTQVGTIQIKNGEEVIGEYPILINQDVEKISFLQTFVNTFTDMFTGIK